ncbi:MAG TPA: hypothetical protein VF686_03750 [Brevundimonas sp.]
MKKVLLGCAYILAITLSSTPTPTQAGGLNCWYEFIYASDENGMPTDVILEVIPHCEVEQEEVE